MKKKEFDRKQEDSKKIIDFIGLYEKRSTSAQEQALSERLVKVGHDVEGIITEVSTLESALVLRKKELANLVKQYDKLLRDAAKVKKGIDSKTKEEIKSELKLKSKEIADKAKKKDSPIPVPAAQAKKKEEKEEKEAVEAKLESVEVQKEKIVKKNKS